MFAIGRRCPSVTGGRSIGPCVAVCVVQMEDIYFLTTHDLISPLERGGQFRDRLRGALVDWLTVAEDGALKIQFRKLLDALLCLSHVGGVLGIGTTELIVDVVHSIAEDEH